jgi:hypothetical protein
VNPDQLARATAALDVWFDPGPGGYRAPGLMWDQHELESMHAALEAPNTDAALKAFGVATGSGLSTSEQDARNRDAMIELRQLLSRDAGTASNIERLELPPGAEAANQAGLSDGTAEMIGPATERIASDWRNAEAATPEPARQPAASHPAKDLTVSSAGPAAPGPGSSDATKGAGGPPTFPAVDFPNLNTGNTTPWVDEIRRVLADGGFPGTPAECQHMCREHGADPATVARDAPTQELAGRIHDAAHLHPGAPWGEVVARAWAEAWWEARQWQYRERPEITAQVEVLRAGDARQMTLTRDETETGPREPWVMEDPAEWRVFFREVFGRDMPQNAEHEARLHQLDAAELLTRDMWTNGPDGTSYLHGFHVGELAAERGGLSFPQLYEQRYLQLSAGRREPQGQTAASGPAQLASASFPGRVTRRPSQPVQRQPGRRSR